MTFGLPWSVNPRRIGSNMKLLWIIPANKLVKLVFKPHVSADERMSSDSYKITKVTNLEYWFDEFAMEKVN